MCTECTEATSGPFSYPHGKPDESNKAILGDKKTNITDSTELPKSISLVIVLTVLSYILSEDKVKSARNVECQHSICSFNRANGYHRDRGTQTEDITTKHKHVNTTLSITSKNLERDLNPLFESNNLPSEYTVEKFSPESESNALSEIVSSQQSPVLPNRLDEQVEEIKRNLQNCEQQKLESLESVLAANREMSVLQEKMVSLKQENEIFKRRKTICVMCINQQKLRLISRTLVKMRLQYQIPFNVEIIERKLQVLAVSDADFGGAQMVILVGIAEPRNMLASETEPSQLGVALKKAYALKRQVFVVFVGDKYPDTLKDNQAYHASLNSLFASQKAIGELVEKKPIYKRQVERKRHRAKTDIITKYTNLRLD